MKIHSNMQVSLLRGFLGLLLVVFVCLIAQTRAAADSPLIEVDVNFKQVAFNINNSQLYTYDPYDQLASLLKTPGIVAFFDNQQCQMFDLQTSQYIAPSTSLFDTFVHHETQLHCGEHKFQITPIQDWKVGLTQEDIIEFRNNYLKSVSSGELTPYPNYRTAMVSLSLDTYIGWALAFLKYHWGPIHDFLTYPSTVEEVESTNAQDVGIYSFDGRTLSMKESQVLGAKSTQPLEPGSAPEQTTIFAVTADWGSGTPESQLVSNLMKNHDPHYTINVGDLYLVGSPEDARRNALGIRYSNDTFTNAVKWRPGSLGSLWFQGNHEMYSRGFGYFDSILPTMGLFDPHTGQPQGQATSYRIMESKYWRIVFLDSGYTTYSPLIHSDANPLLPPVVEWLTNIVKLGNVNDKRGVIIMLHHDYFSAFGKDGYADIPTQLSKILGNRVILTFWGHEHKTSVYAPSNLAGLNTYARCIGTGGFPVDHIASPPASRDADLQAYDNRIFDELEGGPFNTPNAHKDGDKYQIPIGYNGYFIMNFTGHQLTVDYYTMQWANVANRELDWNNGHRTMTETFISDPNTGDVVQQEFKVLDPEITVVTHVNKDMEPVPTNSKNLHIKQPSKLSQAKLSAKANFQQRIAGFKNLEEYFNHWKSLTYTQNINPAPQFSEETTKVALEKYILAMIEANKLTPEQLQQDTNTIVSKLSHQLDDVVLTMLGRGNSQFEKQCPNVLKSSKPVETPADIDSFSIDTTQVVEIDGHIFPLIKF